MPASQDSTINRLFPQQSTGRIAVKVIHHYGDDVEGPAVRREADGAADRPS